MGNLSKCYILHLHNDGATYNNHRQLWFGIQNPLKSTYRRRLDGVQRNVCMRIVGAMVTAPIWAIKAMLGLLPVCLFIRSTAAISDLRTKSFESSIEV